MRLFYYVHTGHRIGLDRFRRAATIIRALGDVDITLLTSDFRIASAAREYGIERAVGVDVVRNIPQIARNGDKIIFDSEEINPVMLDDMTRYFSTFIRVSDDPNDVKHPGELLISPYLEGEGIFNGVVVDDACFGVKEKTIERTLFFGDDDYEESLAGMQEAFAGLDFDLLEGFYWFLGYGEKLSGTFKTRHDEETYEEVISHSKILLSASPQAVLENLAGGGKPIYFQRPDYPDHFVKLFNTLNIPVLTIKNIHNLLILLNSVSSQKYQPCPKTTEEIVSYLGHNLNL
jgi:hypothetical protein